MVPGLHREHPGNVRGLRSQRLGPACNVTSFSFPVSAAFNRARVWRMEIRLPTPYGPPTQPVLTSQQCDAVALDLALEQFGVFVGMVHHERPAEAGREGDLRFLAEADFGAGDLGGVAADELVQRLVRASAARSAASRPMASQVSRMMFFGCPAFFSGTALAMNSSG